jgi:hypothetical protein
MLSDVFHTNYHTVLDTLILTTDFSVYLIWTKGSWRVWPVDRGCFTPPRHLITPLVYPGVRVRPISLICIHYSIYEIDHCSLFLPFTISVTISRVWRNSNRWLKCLGCLSNRGMQFLVLLTLGWTNASSHDASFCTNLQYQDCWGSIRPKEVSRTVREVANHA